MQIFTAIANSTDTGDGLDASESADFNTLPAAERWINRRAGRYLGASIYEVEREPCAPHGDPRCERLACTYRGGPPETEIRHRVYGPDGTGGFELEEIVEASDG